MEGSDCAKDEESVANVDQQKSPPEDPVPSIKPSESVRVVPTDSPASPT